MLIHRTHITIKGILDIFVEIILMGITALALHVLFMHNTELPSGQLADKWACLYKNGSIALFLYVIIVMIQPRRCTRVIAPAVSIVLMATAVCEVVIAIRQLYGFEPSNHALYRFTGTFLNPGPFSGYIAMALPLAVHGWLTYKECWRGYIFLGLVSLCLIVLPAGMSRSAWIAAAISTICVCFMHHPQTCKKGIQWISKSTKHKLYLTGIFIIIISMGAGAYWLKKDSANGRLFMWKISSLVIAEKPWKGCGSEGFSAAYSQAQEKYFATGNYTIQEEHVAGTPDYAFNEYLQIGIERGIPVLLITLIIIGILLWFLIKRREYGIAGAIISVGVFAFSSYPLQLPNFTAAIAILLVVPLLQATGLIIEGASTISQKVGIRIIFLLIISGVGWLGINKYLIWEKRREACLEWKNVRTLYQMEAYETAMRSYSHLYECMKWNYTYLFEYAHACHKKGQYEKSNELLKEAGKLCGDPMILNIMGKNYQGMKLFKQAEETLMRSIHRLPGRLYPYYLLMRLYNEPDFHQSEKLLATANTVLEKEPKVHSKAVEEMREEAKKVIEGFKQQVPTELK